MSTGSSGGSTTLPPITDVGGGDPPPPPRTNDLIDGKMFKLVMKNNTRQVTIVRTFEKVYMGGWFIEFKGGNNRKSILPMDTFMDNAKVLDTNGHEWLGEQE